MKQDHINHARRRSLLLRIHLWAALIASPFAVVAACTGLVYVFTPQIEQVLYGHLDHVAPAGQRLPLDQIVKAARDVTPSGLELSSVTVPSRTDESVRVTFSLLRPHRLAPARAPAGAAAPAWSDRFPRGIFVYVDPYSSAVLGSQSELKRFNVWARRLHSSLAQGDGWRWPIELSASWLMVMLVTGVAVWWPGSGAPGTATRTGGGWRHWHALAGVTLSLLSLAMLATGLTWSRLAGDEIRTLRDAIGQASPMPPRGLASAPAAGQAPLGWEPVLALTRRQAPEVPVQIMPPRGERGAWRVSAVDRGEPFGRFNLVLDAYSGRTLFYAGWERQTVFGKATALGIPFHRAELGWWNQALLVLFGAGIVFSMASGWIMCARRLRHGAPLLPRVLPGAWGAIPAPAWIVALALLALMPMLAISAPLVVAVEACLAWRRRGARLAMT